MPGSAYAALTRVTAAMFNACLVSVNLGDAVDAASGATTPSVPGMHIVTLADTGAAPSTGTTDIILDKKERVTDVRIVKQSATGAGGVNTVQVRTGAGAAISDAISIAIADQLIARAASIDDATHEIAALSTLRVYQDKQAGAGNNACTVYITVVKVA